jgi:PIN domain nuclease of toxin-antitoxin system
MKLLMDSHAFIWMHDYPNKLSTEVTDQIIDPLNLIFLSVAAVWELQIKIKLGKFGFSDSLENVITQQRQVNDLQILPVELSHALYLEKLPLHHKDPFDRLLIAQTIVEDMTLVSSDKQFSKYDVDLLW